LRLSLPLLLPLFFVVILSGAKDPCICLCRCPCRVPNPSRICEGWDVYRQPTQKPLLLLSSLLLPSFFVVILSGAKDPRIFPLPFPLLVLLLSFRSAAKESAFVSNPPQK
jgi:hypothetical protein